MKLALVSLLLAVPALAISRIDFGNGILSGLGAPTCHNNSAVMVGWAQAEGSPCSYNMLDTTKAASGASNCNSVGVKNYPSASAGIDATVATLKLSYYTGIVERLKRCASAEDTAHAIESSPWGTGSLAVTCIDQAAHSSSTYSDWGNKAVKG